MISDELLVEFTANNLLERIESSIMGLKKFPYACSLVLDENLKNRGYRKLVVGNYIAFYLVNDSEKQVIIMRILYSAQNYENLL